MPRQGGESGKLGDRYELLWVVDALLHVLEGTARSLTFEPVGEDAVGVEFFVDHSDGTREFLSAKRQKADSEWKITDLIGVKPKARSILGDLFEHLDGGPSSRCTFVSSTGSSQILKLTEIAKQCASFSDFKNLLTDYGKSVNGHFQSVCRRSGRTAEDVFDKLRRLTVRLVDESSHLSAVLSHIRHLVHRPDPQPNDDSTVRGLLADHLLKAMGRPISADEVWKELKRSGFERRGWVQGKSLHEIIAKSNRHYQDHTEASLINGRIVPRPEADKIASQVLAPDYAGSLFVVAAAGVGKSCVLVQVLGQLERAKIPVLVIKLDLLTDAIHADDIGRRMRLPSSPVDALAAAANGQRCVLIVDQLDAISSASGRNQSLWDAVRELLEQAEGYSQMRLVLACRSFDARNDPKLRKLHERAGTTAVVIDKLNVPTVTAILLEVGEDPGRLSSSQLELLAVPLHLSLFIESRTASESRWDFSTHSELFERFWNYKQEAVSVRLGGGQLAEFSATVDALARRMTDRESLEVPRDSCADREDAIRALLTEHVLVQDGTSLRFFHESFLDYAVARGFLSSDRSLVETLSSGHQGLFCRSLVRQVLTLLRDKDFSRYLTTLRELVEDVRIRYHVQKLVFAWLGYLPDPREDEWSLLQTRLSDSGWRGRILAPLHGRLPWFDLLYRTGTLAGWLHSSDPDLVETGWWQVSAHELRQPRSTEIAELVRPFVAGDDRWQMRFRSLFRFGNAHHSRAMQEVFLALFDRGAFDEPQDGHRGSWWRSVEDAAKHDPGFVLEVIDHWLTRGESALPSERFGRPEPGVVGWSDRDDAAVGVIEVLAESSPRQFVRTVFPFLERFVDRFVIAGGQGLDRDTAWPYRYNVSPRKPGESLLLGVRRGVAWIARNAPDVFQELFQPHVNTTSFTISELMLQGFISNPTRFADQCATFLQKDPLRLNVGHSGGVGINRGDGHAAISREALMACAPHMSSDDLLKIEGVVVATDFDSEIDRFSGWTQRLLLEAIGHERLTATGQEFLTSLRDRFPQQVLELPALDEDGAMVEVVSPVPSHELALFGNAELLDAMRRYSAGWDDPGPGTVDLFEGGAVELSREIQILARRERGRFIALADAMEDGLHHLYFAEIVNGVFAISTQGAFDRVADAAEFEATSTEELLRLLRRVHRLPGRPCGTEFCRALAKIADREIPEADLLMVEHYALHDPEPKSDDPWLQHADATNWSCMARQHGFNTARGVAAESISSLLFADDARMPVLQPILEQMVNDPTDAVRSCVIQALLPVWNDDRDTAVKLFLRLCDGRPVLWGTDRFELFGRHAVREFYGELRDMLLTGIETGAKEAVGATARLICLAAFGNELASADAERVRTGNPMARRAAAKVYARNVATPQIRVECETRLRAFFSDPDEEVRAAAAKVFGNISADSIGQFRSLVDAYVESPAFPSNHDHFLSILDESGWRIPEVTLLVAERVVACAASAHEGDSPVGVIDAGHVARLVVQLCAKTMDHGLRRDCLDLLDRMEWLGFYGVNEQLRELER